jgi:hypothetical protein
MTVSFTNTPIAEAPDPAGPLMRLVGPRGTDTVNHGRLCFTISPDGGFYLPVEVANALTTGVAGFVRQELSANDLLSAVARAVQALPAGHRFKVRLNQALADLCEDATPSAPTA